MNRTLMLILALVLIAVGAWLAYRGGYSLGAN